MTLWDLPAGQSARIALLQPELPAHVQQRLRDLGFHDGGAVTTVIAPRLGAPRLYRVNNAVYSLDHLVAHRIDITTH